MNQKGRVYISKRVREILKLKPGQTFVVEACGDDTISMVKPPKAPVGKDQVLKDMVEHPLRLKGTKLTKEILGRLEEETWSR